MPTPRIGDPTATQSPSAQPGTGVFPTQDLPADSDPPNAATFAQAYKVCADFIAWLMSPFLVIGTVLTLALIEFRNARQARVWGLDHWAFPSNRLHEIKEDWLDAAAVDKTAAASLGGPWFGKWNYGIFNGGGIGHVYANGPTGNLSTSPWGPVCGLDFNGFTIGPAATVVESAKPWMYMSEDALEFEFDFSLTGSALLSDTTIGVGLGDGTMVNGSTSPMNTGSAIPAVGAFLYRPASGGTWIAHSRPVGGGGTDTTTTVAVAENAPRRYKIVIVGGFASDDTIARVLHYIDGALVANHTVDMVAAMLYPFFRIQGDQADVTVLEIGPIKFTPRLALGDAPI